MTNSKKLLGKLNDRPMDYEGVSGGTSGSGLSGLDIAGAMAMGHVTPEEEMILRIKWVQDKSVMSEFLYNMLYWTSGLANREQWRIPKGEDFLRKLVRLAVLEVDDPKICPTCKGRGSAMINHKIVVCETCEGRSRKNWSDWQRSRALGIDRANFKRTWKKRYYQIVDEIRRMERAGLYKLADGLERPDLELEIEAMLANDGFEQSGER